VTVSVQTGDHHQPDDRAAEEDTQLHPKPSPIALKALIHGTFNSLKFAVTQSVDIHADHNQPVIRTADATIYPVQSDCRLSGNASCRRAAQLPPGPSSPDMLRKKSIVLQFVI